MSGGRFDGEVAKLREKMSRHAGPEDSPAAQAIHGMIALTERMGEALRVMEDRQSGASMAEAVRLAARQGIAKAAQEATHRWRWSRAAWVACAGAAVALCAFLSGYRAGQEEQGQANAWAAAELQQAFHSGSGGAVWLAGVVANNDPEQLTRWCAGHSYPDQGGVACTVPVWTKRPMPRQQ